MQGKSIQHGRLGTSRSSLCASSHKIEVNHYKMELDIESSANEANKRKRRSLLLIGYHVCSIMIITLINLNGGLSSGPCNPGTGLLLFLFAFILLIVLLAGSILLIIRDKSNKVFLIINLSALAIWIATLFLFK